ncbi:MAG TPA: hypothetical protein VKA64_02250 [Gammaproteobacteria bacterium]|nr:hypothetical protein [Gammaproteobacteria bacterium]
MTEKRTGVGGPHRLGRWFLLAVAGGLYLGTAVPAIADTSRYAVSAGVERFLWREYDTSGDKLLEEEGPRFFIGMDGERTMPSNWTYGFRARAYSGEVDYDGQTQAGSTLETDTDYEGIELALDFSHPLAAEGGSSPASLRFGLGVDWWDRTIEDTATASGYTERYRIPYLDFGLTYRWNETVGFYAEGGVKHPFSTKESIDDLGNYDDVDLEPEGDFSPYLGIGYRFPARWDIELSYETYRFDRSDDEPLKQNGVQVGTVTQPESKQDTIALNVRYWF